MIVGIHHIAVGVDDLDKAVTFYTEGLGFELVQQSELDNQPQVDQVIGLKNVKARQAMLKASNAHIEVFEYANPEPKDLRSRPCDYGYPHFALQVDDIQSEYERLQQHGMTFAAEVVHFGEASSAIYGKDPFGNVIELYEIKNADMSQLAR
ncbi:MAG: glyoxalase/bleomycin resistance/dioxygenase family protein [Gammaproteobacteria bacterium]|jgi:glyoxylase I family protein|nr:glyoxalase/bleomycin resistance/dioxygenase family protein [Gammaproteobacteria bacterium]MBT4492704.1 glyoxalase/bleomycin resistance/dioxygenase family protein [Gammaproteobacteria bacterium]